MGILFPNTRSKQRAADSPSAQMPAGSPLLQGNSQSSNTSSNGIRSHRQILRLPPPLLPVTTPRWFPRVSHPQNVNPTAQAFSLVNLLKRLTELKKTLATFHEKILQKYSWAGEVWESCPTSVPTLSFWVSVNTPLNKHDANRLHEETQQTLCSGAWWLLLCSFLLSRVWGLRTHYGTRHIRVLSQELLMKARYTE